MKSSIDLPYQHILLALDNSVHSHFVEDIGILFAQQCNAVIIGLHVYSGSLHRTRFKTLEEFLPEKYQKEEVLEYQRKIHSVLIERGLEIISYEYMKAVKEKCAQCNLSFEERLIDGKNSDVIIDQAASCGLVMMGAQGMSAASGFSHLGSNTRRVLRSIHSDLLVVRTNNGFKRMAVGLDGSPCSWLALQRAISLAQRFGSELVLFSSFDPQLHPKVFQSLATVLSDEAGRVFKFKEQEQLHTLVIDTSLEDLYKELLVKGREQASREGISVTTELLQGKPYYSLFTRLQGGDIDLLIMGRNGMHQGIYDTIGSNTERIVELSPTNVLVVTEENILPQPSQTTVSVKQDVPKVEGVQWDDEAKKRLENIPGFARPMAVLAIERYAKEKGIAIITPAVMREARDHHD